MKIPRQKPSIRRSADDREITVYAIIVRMPGAIEEDQVPIKVGCTAKPKELLKHMALFCPYPVEMVSIGMLPGPALMSRVMSELRRALEMASVEMLKERGGVVFLQACEHRKCASAHAFEAEMTPTPLDSTIGYQRRIDCFEQLESEVTAMNDLPYSASAVIVWLPEGISPEMSNFVIDEDNKLSPPFPNPDAWWELRDAIRYVCTADLGNHNKKPWIKTGNKILSPDEILADYKNWAVK